VRAQARDAGRDVAGQHVAVGEVAAVLRSIGNGGIADEALDAQGLQRRVVVSASTFHSVLELVERSDLVGLVPARLVEGRDVRLRVLEPPLTVPGFAIHMAWHDRNHGDAAQRWVRERLVAFAREAESGA
jgi:DNA-binding transcriptional LysR family regulator